MTMDGLAIVVVLVCFLAILVVAVGSPRRAAGAPRIPRRHRDRGDVIEEDTDPDDIADDDAPSRDDD